MTDGNYKPHPKLKEWAHKRWEIDSEIFKFLQSAPRIEVEAIRASAEQSSETNCWYAVWDISKSVILECEARKRNDDLKAMG